MPESISEQLIAAARALASSVDALRFSAPVTHVYNPLDYAWPAHEEYLRRFAGSRKRILFVGMNPGPFGMVQTGIPFGEVPSVRDWMEIHAPIGHPPREHPKRPVLGFACPRCEISGQRLWGLFAKRFGAARDFFQEHFVVNYCPLAFLEGSGRNLTPDKLWKAESEQLFAACDAHLRRVIQILQPEWIVGVGGFALERIRHVHTGTLPRVTTILHPSPASPAANRNWAELATRQLEECGAWGRS